MKLQLLLSLPFFRHYWLLALLVLGAACTAPRSIIHSGKVTNKGEFKAGFNVGTNLASEPLGQLDDITRAAVDAVTNRDSVFYDEQIDVFARAFTAYALDPVGPAFDVYVRYGPVTRLDVGYKFASGVHVVDAMYQFLGPTGTPESPGIGFIYGSIGLQYSGQNANFFSRFFLDRLAPVLDFSAKRRDFVVPLVFSRSFGFEEEKGNISWGVVYHHTFIRYGFEPGSIFTRLGNRVERINPVRESNNFPAFGAFVNGKLGYKFIYVLPAIAVYYQNYGTYELLGNKEFEFSGITVVPTIGLQFRIRGRNR